MTSTTPPPARLPAVPSGGGDGGDGDDPILAATVRARHRARESGRPGALVVGMDLAGSGSDKSALSVVAVWQTTERERRATGLRHVGEVLHVEAYGRLRPLEHGRLLLDRFDHWTAPIPAGWRVGMVVDNTGDHGREGLPFRVAAEVRRRRALGQYAGRVPSVAAYRWVAGSARRKVPLEAGGESGCREWTVGRGFLVGGLVTSLNGRALSMAGLGDEQHADLERELRGMRTGTERRGADHERGGHDDRLAATAMAWSHGQVLAPGTSGGTVDWSARVS